jgi:hypothetical protein
LYLRTVFKAIAEWQNGKEVEGRNRPVAPRSLD